MELDVKSSLQWVNLLAPSPQHTHHLSRQHLDDNRGYYPMNPGQLYNYGMNNSSLSFNDTTLYRWHEEEEETYSKQELSLSYMTEMKTENYAMNLDEAKQMNAQCMDYQHHLQQCNTSQPSSEDYRSSKNTLMSGNIWRSESSTSPSTMATTEEEMEASPTAPSRIIPEQYSWQLETMSRQDLIKRLIHLETEKALQGSMNHNSELLDNDMSCQINRTIPTSVSSYEAPISREVSRESLDRYNSLERDQNLKVCLWHSCHQSFGNLDLLITHVRNVHVGRGKPSYPCQWQGCRMQVHHPFAKRHKLLSHMRTHTGEKPYQCTSKGCNKSFSRPDSLDIHIKTHSNVRPFKCTYEGCTKAYYHARSLKKHEKVHLKTVADKPNVYTASAIGAPHAHHVVAQAETHTYQNQNTSHIQKSDTQALLESQNCLSYGALWQPMLSYLCYADPRSQQNAPYYVSSLPGNCN